MSKRQPVQMGELPSEEIQPHGCLLAQRRSFASTGSVIDSVTSPTDAIPSFPPSNIGMATQIPESESLGVQQQSHPHEDTFGASFTQLPVERQSKSHIPTTDTPKKRKYCFVLNSCSKTASRKIVDCIVSGTLLAICLIIYLALAFTSPDRGRGFHITSILALMVLTIYFCHSFIRLFMSANRRVGRPCNRHICSSPEGLGLGHLNGRISVEIAGDEENALEYNLHGHDKPIARPPPAYGLWRGSVKINPDTLYWRRAEQANLEGSQTNEFVDGSRSTAPRPPSYCSEASH
ncbi:hypothetical protein FQN57_006096 [Myotisia sp. PD_48]|nr:hypothetical protein FQN57_006096 [Myotisia sp. PD_48]